MTALHGNDRSATSTVHKETHKMTASRTRTAIAALVFTLGALLALAGPASAKIIHEQEGTFLLGGGFASIAVDNSAGPAAGKVWIGKTEVDLIPARAWGASKAYQLDAEGIPTGVELDGSETPAGFFGFASSTGSFSLFTGKLAHGIAVDGSTGANAGNVYIADLQHGVVDRFKEGAGGNFVFDCQITGKIPVSGEEIAHECAGATGSEPTGGPAGLEPLAVAVNPVNGRVAVGNASNHVVYEFNENGTYAGKIESTYITEPGSLAFDSTGSLYLVNANASLFTSLGGDGVKFDSAGNFKYVVTTNSRSDVGVDTGTDHVYFGTAHSGEIEEYDASGNLVTTFGSSTLSIDANESTHQVYVTPAVISGEGQIWSGDIFVPNVTTGVATEVEETTATLHGAVDPEASKGGSNVTSCEFEYVEAAKYNPSEPNPYGAGKTASCLPTTPYTSATPVSAVLSGLTPSTTYHYRLVAKNAEAKEGQGEDATFTTFGPPSIGGELSIARTNSAMVKAQIDPFGYETTCEVQYVDQARFEASGYAGAATAPCPEAIPAGFGDQSASVELGGLTIGTVYHYRFVAHNQATIQGGTTVGKDQTFSTFGIESFSIETLDREGNPYTQAGGHPYEMRIKLALTTTAAESSRKPESATANLKTVKVALPPGLIGNPTATARCEPYQMSGGVCPGATQIGWAQIFSPNEHSAPFAADAVYSLAPPVGVAAQLGSNFDKLGTVRIDAGVRTGSDYGIEADTLSVTADESVSRVEMTIWGVPADEGHDGQRRKSTTGTALLPFLTNPTSCTGPLTGSVSVDAWQEPGNFVSKDSSMPAISGCELLDFKPSISVESTSAAAGSPTGLNVDLKVPQNQNPEGLAEADLKDATVTLPAGLTVNPSAANGLEACSEAQIGYLPSKSAEVGHPQFTPDAASCPDASKVGSVEVVTPLLDHALKGGVYLAAQDANPFKSLLALYIAVHDPASGVVLKLPGKVTADPATGQLRATFAENPQLPFEDMKLEFFGGERASLMTPQACGQYAASASFTSWAAPDSSVSPSVQPFAISSGCAPGFAPSFTAGTVSNTAGSFSPFALSFARSDGEQQIKGLTFTMPPGASAKLAGVPECSDADAAAGTCPESTRIGSVTAGSGAGSNPFFLKGSVYLTGPYNGGPFGAAVVVAANAGPFHLGNVVVRGSIRIDPRTAQPTVVSDPFPQFVGSTGIPTDIRRVDVTLDRPGFSFNPTSCAELHTTGTLTSVGGASAALSQRFQAADCARLAFKPSFKVSTSGKTSRKNGASLDVKLSYPKDAMGKYANIRSVKVNLPKQLPSRLTTLQKACPEATFNANPASCPAASRVGTAKAVTPILPVSLNGPAYFVSHGGAKFPELIIVLQGDGVTVDLHGETFISKAGITSSTYRQVPDVPVSAFELKLPQGPYSALAANGNLCKVKGGLKMPTMFTAQNGLQIKQSTPIGVTGCAKSKAKAKTKGNKK